MADGKAGRPKIAISAQQLKQIEVLAGYGLSEPQIARAVGLSLRTLARRKNDEASFADAIERGKAVAAGIVGKALFKRAESGDVAAIRWYEMTRLGKSERTVATSATLDLGSCSDEELERLAAGEAPEVVLATRSRGGRGK